MVISLDQNDQRQFQLESWQDGYIFSEARFPAMISAWATGKSMSLIMRAMRYSELYENNLGIIFRREFTDLRDSTIRDFELYTGLHVSANDHSVTLPNGSTILFRHAKDIDKAIKQNLNLGWFIIEQAEELETPETFIMLAFGRLRRQVPYTWGSIVANARGHWWGWKMWLEKDVKTGKVKGIRNPETNELLSECFEATSWDNAHNIPKETSESWKALAQIEPSVYQQYVMNNHDQEVEGNFLIPESYVEKSVSLNFVPSGGKILAIDVARSREGDETVFTIIQRCGPRAWKQILLHGFRGYDLAKTMTTVSMLRAEHVPYRIIIDTGGLGITYSDRMNELKIPHSAFDGSSVDVRPGFKNLRAQAWYKTRDMLREGELELFGDERLHYQLTHIKYRFFSNGERLMESKDDMKRRGEKSPDRADATIMAVHCVESLPDKEEIKTSAEEFWDRVKDDLRKADGTRKREWRKI